MATIAGAGVSGFPIARPMVAFNFSYHGGDVSAADWSHRGTELVHTVVPVAKLVI